MKRKNKKFTKRSQNPLNKLSLFQKADGRFINRSDWRIQIRF